MKIKKATLIVIILIVGLNINAQPVKRGRTEHSISIPSLLLDNQKPVANWIWDSGSDNPQNYYLLIRKTVDLTQVPIDAKAYISAYAYADVYINGKLVDRCPMNCDPEFQVYEKFDLTSYFRKGKNTISALVYNFGVGMHHRINGRGGFFFQAALTSENNKIHRINTDSSWLVSKAEAWDNQTEMRHATAHLIGFVEKFDARRMPDKWKESDFDDTEWKPARMLGVPPVKPWNNIVEVTRPPLYREQVHPVRHWFVGDKIIYDFGKEIAGTPILKLISREGGNTLEILTSERLTPDSSAVLFPVSFKDFYISKKGEQTWSPLTWRGFRYLSISQKSSIIIKEISAINRHYNLVREGSFSCSDPQLNRIWEVGNQTLLLCAQDTYIDTPFREQTQYIGGDTRYDQNYAFYTFGMSSELLIRYNILSGAWSQRWKNDGSIRTRYPTDWMLDIGLSAYLPDYELEWIIMQGEYYNYFGKADLLVQVYPNMKRLMNSFCKYIGKEHGLLSKVPGWIVLDHPDSDPPMDLLDEITGLNCLYYGALKQAAFIAQNIASDPVQGAQWTKQAIQIKQNIQKWLWSPERHLFVDSYGSKSCSQQAQVYALYYGLVDEKEKEHIVDAIVSGNRSSEESFSYYVLKSVFDKKPQWSIDFIRKYWGEQMRSPSFNGAWHEAWHDMSGSTSHGWCSGPTALLPQKVLGVEPKTGGWKTFSVHPNPCDLKWAKGIIPSPFGSVYVDWKYENNGDFRLYVRVPENTSAEIVVPESNPKKVRINGMPADSCSRVKATEFVNDKLVLKVPCGEYEILSSK